MLAASFEYLMRQKEDDNDDEDFDGLDGEGAGDAGVTTAGEDAEFSRAELEAEALGWGRRWPRTSPPRFRAG